MVKNSRRITHFMERRRRPLGGCFLLPSLLPALPPPLVDLRFDVVLLLAEKRDTPFPLDDKTGRSKPKSERDFLATRATLYSD